MVRLCVITLLMMCKVQVAFSAPHDSKYLAELELAEQRWKSAAITEYRYTLTRGAGPFGYSIYRVSVREAKCSASSRYIFGKRGPWRRTSCDGVTMSDLFEDLRRELERGTLSVDVEFDSEFGYIRSLRVEPDTDSTDSDWHLDVSKFKVLR
jgi:hypothetical protein